MRSSKGAPPTADPLTERYANVVARFIAFPATVPAGGGWWRQVWQVEHSQTPSPALPALPVPLSEGPEFTAIGATLVGVFQSGTSCLRVEVLSRQRQLSSEEVGYVSLLMQALQRSLGPLRINGYEDHPILHVTQIPPASAPG